MRRIHAMLIIALVFMGWRAAALAQTNPYAYGSPNYWMAQATLDISNCRFDKAYSNLQRASKGYKSNGDRTNQIRAIECMGMLKTNIGEWSLAWQHFQEALSLAKEANDDTSYANILAEVIAYCKSIGDINGYNRFVGGLDSLYKHTSLATVKIIYHTYWSNEYMARQEYAMVKYHLQQCWSAIQALSFIDKEQAKLSYFNNMMAINRQMKDYDEAIKYAKQYVNQSQIVNGYHSNLHLQSYGILVGLYTEIKDSISTFAALDSIELGIGHSDQDNSMLSVFYNTKGYTYEAFHNYGKAIEYFDKAYDLMIGEPTESALSKCNYYERKAEVLYKQGKFDEAYIIYKNCVNAFRSKYGDESGEYYRTINTLAHLAAMKGNTSEADSLFRISTNYLLANMKSQWRQLTATDRDVYWKTFLNNMSGMANFCFKCNIYSSVLTETCYNALLFSKALLLETEKTMLDILAHEGTEEDIDSYRQLLAIDSKLLSLKRNYDYNKNEIDHLSLRQRDLERQLADRCKLYDEYNAFLNIDYNWVRHKLNDNEILVDFSDFYTEDSVHVYAAYIIKRGQEHPQLVECFRQEQIDSLLDVEARYNLYNYDFHKDYATKLLWDPLKRYVEEGSTVYYVPSGIIYQVAIESLPLSDGSILGQHYDFIRLSSAREIGKGKNIDSANRTATLYGGLKYDLTSDVLEEESNIYDKSDLSWIYRSAYGDKGFKELRKTREEIAKIANTLKSNGYNVKIYSGTRGNAESFIAMSGNSPSILHIATHGFYYSPDKAKDYDYLEGYADAMSLSGLVFSGGNAAWLGKDIPKGVLGGILTARDIANLNFKGTDLVVLTACKTAQGQVTAEGIYGLQRAFKKAGAGTLVLTLWNVRDVVAETFATTFYQELILQNCNKRGAFECTKRLMRQNFKDPFDWACFIMID